MQFIRDVVNPSWGVWPEAIETIEALYTQLLDKLNAHFAEHPYLLGGRPSVGDFGMMAPLYGTPWTGSGAPTADADARGSGLPVGGTNEPAGTRRRRVRGLR